MTIAGDALWCCPYTDFPIVFIERGSIRHWRNQHVHGASAIAVDADHIVLAGGYAEDAQRIALLRLGSNAERIG